MGFDLTASGATGPINIFSLLLIGTFFKNEIYIWELDMS